MIRIKFQNLDIETSLPVDCLNESEYFQAVIQKQTEHYLKEHEICMSMKMYTEKVVYQTTPIYISFVPKTCIKHLLNYLTEKKLPLAEEITDELLSVAITLGMNQFLASLMASTKTNLPSASISSSSPCTSDFL